MKKTSLIIGTILALGVSLVGCNPKTDLPNEQETIEIGFTGPLSGDSAILGNENLNGIKLAIDRLNADPKNGNIKFKIIVKDDQLEDKQTIANYKYLTTIENIDHVLAVAFGGFIALGKQPEQDNVILINSLDSSEELVNLSKNTFALGVYNEGIGYAIADHLNINKIEQVGVISNMEDPFILLVENALSNRYTGQIQRETYNFETKDFRTILSKLRSNEYVVLLGWEETGRIVRQARELGLTNKIMGIDTFASQDFRDNTNGNYDGLLFTFWQGSEDNQVYRQMLIDYKNKFKKEPDNVLFTATGYDSMLVLGEVIKKCGNDTTCAADELRYNIKNFPGATGKITIDPDRITRSILESIYTYRDGEIKVVDP